MRQFLPRRLESIKRSRVVATDADPLAGVDARSEVAQIVERVVAMPDADSELLLMIAWERLSYDEVAAIIGIPTGTVRSRLHRIRQHLEHHTRKTP